MSYIQRFPMNAKRYIPVVQVSFHTEEKCYQAKGEFVGLGGDLDPTNQVLSVTTQKTLEAPAGAFTVELAGDSWMQRLKSNDLVVISMGYKDIYAKEGVVMSTVMVGLIDTVRRFRTVGEGQPQVNTTITGRDFGKVLIKSALRFFPELGEANPNAEKEGQKFFLTDEGWVTLMGFFTNENITKGTPADILDNIMRHILQKLNQVEWTVWNENSKEPIAKKVKIGNVLRYNFAEVNMFMPMILTADQYEGSLWNLMERVSIKPFTELFVDVREDKEAWNNEGLPRVVNETIKHSSSPEKAKIAGGDTQQGAYPSPRFSFGSDNSAVMVVLRNTPFDKPAWEALYTHELEAVDVIDEDLSFSDNEHYNVFWAGTTINPLGFDLKRAAPPLWNENDVKRYGISPLEVQVEGLSIEPTDEGNTLLEGMSKAFSAKLKAWFEKNHEYMNGTMTVRGKGSYKIGQRLIRAGIEREFYIEGVTQTFNVFTSWETTLQLTRGMRIGTAPNHTRYLPGKAGEAPSKPTSEKSSEEIRSEGYTVKRGDSLWSIAAKPDIYGDGTQWIRLWEANKDQLIARDSRNSSNQGKFIYPGQILRVPR